MILWYGVKHNSAIFNDRNKLKIVNQISTTNLIFLNEKATYLLFSNSLQSSGIDLE